MIQKCGIIGLGAIGGMYASYLTEMLAKEYVYCICDNERLNKYKEKPIKINGKPFDFNFVSSENTAVGTMDLIIIATKFHQLASALESIKNFVGENTIILAAINGVVSEKIIAEAYGSDKVLYCVIQGMDSVKRENEITFTNMGVMAFGNELNNKYSVKVQQVAKFFDLSGFNYEIPFNMKKRMWGKFMLNVGVNQTCAVFDTNYSGYQQEGKIRQTYISAMKEAMAVARAEGVDLSSDLNYWLRVGDNLTPQSMPSMRQDVLAKRKTEVELFGGTVIDLGKKHNIPTPVNAWLVDKIYEIEKTF